MMLTPWVARLLAANVLAFFLQATIPQITTELLLVPAELGSRPWTAVTYMFLHGGFMHLFFNMFGLYIFGPRLEMWLGSRRFLGLYFVSGLAAALVSFVFTPFARIVGASGAIFGILLAFARFWPREQLLIWGIVPVQARWLVIFLAGASLFFGFSGAQAGVAHFAHLGGFAGGWLYLVLVERAGSPAGGGEGLSEKVTGAIKRAGGDRSARQRWDSIDPDSLHEVNREYYLELREKIEREGASALTERERRFLDRMAEQAGDGG